MIIILDIDGVLCFRKFQTNLEKVELGKKIIYPRIGIKEFLEYIFENYQVAVFSSTTEKNADPILKYMLSEEQYDKLVFKWFRDRTRLDKNYEEIYDTVKVLEDIIDNPIINYNRHIKLEDLLMLDDSPKKMRLNDKKNYLIVESDPEYDMRNLISKIN